ncbi:MAG: hypothetical protein MUC48_01940 [Leptolyngbya sp. Prado105]|jgi:predicted site-specific integrase-resolvase|nr:hypothetical protein [Leptolyngbya sp. Prado105]
MEYGCSLAEAARRLQVDQATVLFAMQKGAIATQQRNGRVIVAQAAIAEYQARSRR